MSGMLYCNTLEGLEYAALAYHRFSSAPSIRSRMLVGKFELPVRRILLKVRAISAKIIYKKSTFGVLFKTTHFSSKRPCGKILKHS